MTKYQKKLILDTNLWISFLITKNYNQLDHILFVEDVRLIFSQELLEEFLDVVKRPKFRNFFNSEDIEELLETIEEYANFVQVTSKIELCRDKKDNFLLSLAKDSNADYLVTGDKDLLELKRIKKTTILTITEFLNTIKKK
ncbi:MAG: putative toxin-antitoxin system toxin component, PIN family [Chitinophagales bacterium]|nr:putative toxin-antitoxin system toxin component, PIN family [Chitinophagales bacterium]